jgi:biopolymer transport protein TolR
LEVSLVSDPKALTRNMGIPGRAVVVQVLYRPSESPEYKINNTDVQRADLQAKLTAIYANLAERVVFVKGDDQVEFRYIADVIDIGRASDIDRIALLTSGAVASEKSE